MNDFIKDKIVMDGLTYDDVLLIPAYSEVLPKEVSLKTKFSKNIEFIFFTSVIIISIFIKKAICVLIKA